MKCVRIVCYAPHRLCTTLNAGDSQIWPNLLRCAHMDADFADRLNIFVLCVRAYVSVWNFFCPTLLSGLFVRRCI
jgi:hypothetical protein